MKGMLYHQWLLIRGGLFLWFLMPLVLTIAGSPLQGLAALYACGAILSYGADNACYLNGWYCRLRCSGVAPWKWLGARYLFFVLCQLAILGISLLFWLLPAGSNTPSDLGVLSICWLAFSIHTAFLLMMTLRCVLPGVVSMGVSALAAMSGGMGGMIWLMAAHTRISIQPHWLFLLGTGALVLLALLGWLFTLFIYYRTNLFREV